MTEDGHNYFFGGWSEMPWKKQVPPNADCATCPFLDIDYCEVLGKVVDCKQCGINVIEIEPNPEITYEQTETDTEGSTSPESGV